MEHGSNLHSTSSGTTREQEDVLECHICFEAPTDPVATACCHLFCWDCLYKSLDGQPRPCPVCRTQLRGGITSIHGNHVEVRSVDGPFDGTARSLLHALDCTKSGIEGSKAEVRRMLDLQREGIEALQLYLNRIHVVIMEETTNLERRQVKEIRANLFTRAIVLLREAETRNRKQSEARNGMVEEISRLLREVASTNHLLPIWYPDHIRSTEGSTSRKQADFPGKVLLCQICQTPPMSDTVATSCGHLFCWPCLYKSLGAGLQNWCPVCRTHLTMWNILPIFAGGGSGSHLASVNLIPPRPNWTPSSALVAGLRHESVRSDPILTLRLVRTGLDALKAVPSLNLQWRTRIIAGGWLLFRGGDVTTLNLESRISRLVRETAERDRRHLMERNQMSRLVVELQGLLLHPMWNIPPPTLDIAPV